MNKINRKKCEHCGHTVPHNVYTRNHGSKCPYRGAPEGQKLCKCCLEFIDIGYFAVVTNNTYDGRNGTCNSCLGKKYYTPKHLAI